jgi:predicted transcriptional regulator YdeE
MRLKSIESKIIKGISVRTNNADEMNPSKAKIGHLHQQFDKQVEVRYADGERVYAIYHDYESDASGDYSILCGFDGKSTDDEGLQALTIQAGNYLVFSAKGEIPKIVIDRWGEIWNYFSTDACVYKRTYTTDFEYYKNQTEVEIYIAVE